MSLRESSPININQSDCSNEHLPRYSKSDIYHTTLVSISFQKIRQTSEIRAAENNPLNNKQMLFVETNTSSNVSKTSEQSDGQQRFISSSEFHAYIHSFRAMQNQYLLIIDCGNPFRCNERKVKNSIRINVNDKISRKRLVTRGLQHFLDKNYLQRVNECQIILFYGDSTPKSSNSCHSSTTVEYNLSAPMKCLVEQIERYDPTKRIFILESTFDEFHSQYPDECDCVSIDHDDEETACSTPFIDLDLFPMTEIIPGLFLGNNGDAQNLSLLNEKEIRAILNISQHIPCYFSDEKLFDYLQVHCQDTPHENILQHFDAAVHFIHEYLSKSQSVLVHCHAGISRSPSFVIAYLMKVQSKTFEQAHRLVKERRTICMPNFSFLSQLRRYQQTLDAKDSTPVQDESQNSERFCFSVSI